jgi:hypothetical protein
MPASNIDIGISLLRGVGSVITAGGLSLVLWINIGLDIGYRSRLPELENIAENGVYKHADIDKKVDVKRIKSVKTLTFTYSFREGSSTYKGQYILYSDVPVGDSSAIFTVHYLKDDPNENSLNIYGEIKRLEGLTNVFNTFWLIVKFIVEILVSLFFLVKVVALIKEVRGIIKPTAISDQEVPRT